MRQTRERCAQEGEGASWRGRGGREVEVGEYLGERGLGEGRGGRSGHGETVWDGGGSSNDYESGTRIGPTALNHAPPL